MTLAAHDALAGSHVNAFVAHLRLRTCRRKWHGHLGVGVDFKGQSHVQSHVQTPGLGKPVECPSFNGFAAGLPICRKGLSNVPLARVPYT